MNEEYIKNYLSKLAKSIVEDIEEINSLPWEDPHVFIKLGELTQSMRNAKDNCQNFKEYLKELVVQKLEK